MATRHWKQHWDPNAEFEFLRPVRLPNGQQTQPGDPVTDEIREMLQSLARVRPLAFEPQRAVARLPCDAR